MEWGGVTAHAETARTTQAGYIWSLFSPLRAGRETLDMSVPSRNSGSESKGVGFWCGERGAGVGGEGAAEWEDTRSFAA